MHVKSSANMKHAELEDGETSFCVCAEDDQGVEVVGGWAVG